MDQNISKQNILFQYELLNILFMAHLKLLLITLIFVFAKISHTCFLFFHVLFLRHNGKEIDI